MKKRKIIGLLTFLAGLPGLGSRLIFWFFKGSYTSFGMLFLLSLLKVLFGLPIIHIILNDLLRAYGLKQSSGMG